MADRVTYVGHATVALELSGTELLTDPLLRGRFIHAIRHAPSVPSEAKDGVDGVLISHLHPDHLDFPSLRSIDKRTEFLVPAGGGRLLRRRGFENVREVNPGDIARIGNVEIAVTPAIHDGRRIPLGREVKAVGYDLRGAAHRVYFAGDTDLFAGMAELAEAAGSGNVDVALLPIAGWGPKVGSGHLNAQRAAEAAAMIQPRCVVPIHWGTYLRLGLKRTKPHLLTAPPKHLIDELAERAPHSEAKILEPGESLDLGASGEMYETRA